MAGDSTIYHLTRRIEHLEKEIADFQDAQNSNAVAATSYDENQILMCVSGSAIAIHLYEIVQVSHYSASGTKTNMPNCYRVIDAVAMQLVRGPTSKKAIDIMLWGISLGEASGSDKRVPVQIVGCQFAKIKTDLTGVTGAVLTVGQKLYPNYDGMLQSPDQPDAATKLVTNYKNWPFTLLRPFWGGGDQDVGMVMMNSAASTGISTYPAKITSKVAYNEYKISVYKDGKGEAATETNATLKIPQAHTTAVFPTDTWVMVSEVGDHYEGQPPVWM